jgi:two-component system nitrate/nitrite response regulator NarL
VEERHEPRTSDLALLVEQIAFGDDKPKVFDPGARSLSSREAEILSSLMEGTPNKLIARKLHVTEATVKVHVKAVLRKIGAANRTQAAMWAKGHLHG